MDVKGNLKQVVFLYGLPPLSNCPQGISIANPTTKEPIWIAFTTMTVIVQSSAQNELSNVNRYDTHGGPPLGPKLPMVESEFVLQI